MKERRGDERYPRRCCMVLSYSVLLGSIRSDFNISTLFISVASAANHSVSFPAPLEK